MPWSAKYLPSKPPYTANWLPPSMRNNIKLPPNSCGKAVFSIKCGRKSKTPFKPKPTQTPNT